MFSKSSGIPLCVSLNIITSWQTLSKALDISKKTILTSNSSLKDEQSLWVIYRSWLTQESPDLKPDWLGATRLLARKKN